MGFKAKVHFTCLRVMHPRVTSGATHAFLTNRHTLYKSVPAVSPSHASRRGRAAVDCCLGQQWDSMSGCPLDKREKRRFLFCYLSSDFSHFSLMTEAPQVGKANCDKYSRGHSCNLPCLKASVNITNMSLLISLLINIYWKWLINWL